MKVKTVKGVDEGVWRDIKVMAAREGVNISAVLQRMVEDYSKDSEKFWKRILGGKKILSDKEAKDMNSTIAGLRKEHGFRESL